MFTQEQYNVHFQKSRTIYIKIEILNQQDVVLDRLEGIAIDGQVNLNSESLIRRTADVTFMLKNNLIPSEESKIWINNRIRLWIGLEDYFNNLHYFNLGTYVISDPSIDISISQKTISINLVDKMYIFENTPLEYITKFDAGTNISLIMRNVVKILGGENKILIDNHPYNIPYNLEFNANQSILDIIKEIQELYMNWECFYDENGYFVFRKTLNKLNDQVIWSFIDKADFKMSSNVNINYSNIKNYVKVIGRTLDNGSTVGAIAENDNINSPFAISKIGKKALVINDENYYTNEQCQELANYKLFKHGNFNEQINIGCIPIYLLDVDRLVKFNSLEDNIFGKYCITNLSISLNFNENMNFSAYKIYE